MTQAISIPVIDFAPFAAGTPADRHQVAQQIYQAAQETGFFYLKNYGLSPQQVDRLFAAMRQFFALPIEAKQQVSRSPSTNCGYVPIAGEWLNPARPGDLKEAFNVGQQSQWPPEAPEFQAVVSQMYTLCTTQIAQHILEAFALALELPSGFFAARHTNNFFLRLLHYPPLPAAIAPNQIRAGEHTDYGSMTLLWQDDAGGLEILSAQGEWLPAPTLPETIVVNIGDAMQRWTNDRLRSTPHRVVNPADERAGRSRYSMALFCDPNPEVEIACFASCQSLDQPPRYEPIHYREYLAGRFAETYSNASPGQ